MKRSEIVIILNSLVGRFGFVLIERGELWRMERDAEDYARLLLESTREGIGDRQAGYFHGLSAYAKETARRLRERYSPNAPAHAGAVATRVKPVVGNSGISKKSLNTLAADDYEEYGDDPV